MNSWRPHPSLEREGKILRRVFTSSIKRAIRQFHVLVVQWRQRNALKSVMHVQSCSFDYKTYCFFDFHLCRRRRVAKTPYWANRAEIRERTEEESKYLPWLFDLQTTPASSLGPGVKDTLWGHSWSRDSVPRHCTFSIHWISIPLTPLAPNINVAPRIASSAAGKPSCLQVTFASGRSQVYLSIEPHFPANRTSTRPAYATDAPLRLMLRPGNGENRRNNDTLGWPKVSRQQ